MPRRSDYRELRVGLLVSAAVVLLAVGIFLIGEKSLLFTRKNQYFIRFGTVGGLDEGSPVQLNGVDVGSVEQIVLPEDMGENLLEVWITVNRRYAQRIREDSLARIKTLGLLGDKYVEISSGSPEYAQVPPGQEIQAAPPTDVDKIMASGEDVVQNLVATSHSLANILGRMERGEGLLGRLMAEGSAEGGEALVATFENLQKLTAQLETGQGPVARLIGDGELGDRFASAVERLDRILAQVEESEGLMGALLQDPEPRQKLEDTLDGLKTATDDLSAFMADLRAGEGLLPRLVADPEYGKAVSDELKQLLERLNLVAERLTEGDGSVAQLLSDPEVYQAIEDILVGIDESKLLRWLVRNRQKAGIKKRYEEERQILEDADAQESEPKTVSGQAPEKG